MEEQWCADVCLALKYISTKPSVQMHSPPVFPAERPGACAPLPCTIHAFHFLFPHRSSLFPSCVEVSGLEYPAFLLHSWLSSFSPLANRCFTHSCSQPLQYTVCKPRDTDRNADLPGLPLRIPIMKLLTGGTLKRKHCKEKHMGFFWWGEVEGGKIGRLFSMRTA